MVTTLIAVLGTLAGTLVAGFMQHLTSTRTARAATIERRRAALAEAIPALLAAVVRHREQQYLKIEARKEGLSDTPETRQARYAARSAVTSAMDTLHVVTRDAALLAVAQEAVDAAFAVGDAAPGDLPAAGLRARKAHTALREAAAHHLYA
ncbi:protein kilB [Streptomyces griseorubiginosus]|uniref:protein kilB n=1 Tax=Streptomyces griseorubiginosus TaxID=67304 RepID=UPI0036EDD513